jgi:hypothetical protein
MTLKHWNKFTFQIAIKKRAGIAMCVCTHLEIGLWT